ncbi:hypothetical protein CJ469_03291 [Nocardia farcinica]|uniref:Uncharacterized protein n=1 Tax=Nocardia farcinica TaxID=37329 RepID=A0A449GLK8_NOCFR|nr:hypothetical protein CJ469_03291 [Nocardia farcinica]VFA93478.1 Uncharacterised protein [Nocardia farcinica]
MRPDWSEPPRAVKSISGRAVVRPDRGQLSGTQPLDATVSARSDWPEPTRPWP